MKQNTPTTWHVAKTGNNQGLIISDVTGENIAVTYKAENAPLVAKAPELLDAIKDMLSMLEPSKLRIMAEESGYTVELFLMARANAESLVYQIENDQNELQ